MEQDKLKDVQVYLIELISKLAKDGEWRHTGTQVLAEGRVIIHLKIEKKLKNNLQTL